MEYEVRISGPDDVIVFTDELEAHQRANEINKQYLQHRAEMKNKVAPYIATVHEIEGEA